MVIRIKFGPFWEQFMPQVFFFPHLALDLLSPGWTNEGLALGHIMAHARH